jgi:methionine-rich copper-binding protein CopC
MKLRAFIHVALLLGAATAQAHVKVASTKPADKSRVRTPAAIELGLSESAFLAELTLQRDKEPARKLKIPQAADDVVFTVPLPVLAAGNYIVTYRVESQDGHATTGKFTFTVDPAAPAAAGAKAPAQDASHHDGMQHGAGKDARP